MDDGCVNDFSKRELMNPKVDFVFKLLFGNEQDTSFLISFLNAALELSGEKQINSVMILNPMNDKENESDKFSIMDVKAETDDHTVINIEIQLRDEHDMRQRTVFYLSRMIARRLKEGDQYQELTKTVAINILNFDLFDKASRFHRKFRYKDVETAEELTDIAEIHFMELPALRRYIEENRQNITDIIGKNRLFDWLLFIDNPESELVSVAESVNTTIGRAKDMLRTLSNDEKMQEKYEAREKALMDYYSAVKTAKERGRVEGRLETALNLYDMGMTVQKIAKATNLSEAVIDKALKEREKA
jgi:predicted transposase/invertase (TIGR01784 family)